MSSTLPVDSSEAFAPSLHALVRACFDFVQQREPDAPAARVIKYFESVHPNREVSQATMYRTIKACRQASLQRQLVHHAKGLPVILAQLQRERDAQEATASEVLHLKVRVSELEKQVTALLAKLNVPTPNRHQLARPYIHPKPKKSEAKR